MGKCLHAPSINTYHHEVIKWKHFLRYWPFVWEIHRWAVNSQHKGQWRGALMFSLIYTWTNSCANNGDAGEYEVIVMTWPGSAKSWLYKMVVLSLILFLVVLYNWKQNKTKHNDLSTWCHIIYLSSCRFLGNGLVSDLNHDTWALQRAGMNPAFIRG